jgi:DNA repair photolyase
MSGWEAILAQAPQADARNDVRYLEVAARRVLNPVRAARLPFDLTLNPYLNCELGCAYCYAREFSDKRQGAARADEVFDRVIYAKTGAPSILRDELGRLAASGGLAGKEIALGSATDPYHPDERRARLTRALLEVMAAFDGVRLSVTTKSDLVTRDVDVLQEIARRGQVRVNLTITTVDRDLARSLEPRAPTPGRRLAAVERLSRAGLPAGVLCMPLLPDISDAPRDVRAIVCATKEAGGRWFGTRVLFLKGDAVRSNFFEWLERAFPALVPRYRRWYSAGPGAPDAIVDRVQRLADALRRQYGLPEDVAWPELPAAAPRQLSLFDPLPPAPAPAPAQRAAARPLPVVAADGRAVPA